MVEVLKIGFLTQSIIVNSFNKLIAMSGILDNLKKMLGTKHENQLLHYSIGNEYLKADDLESAEVHLQKAVSIDPDYSAAWKLLGKILNAAEKHDQAIDIFLQGIIVAENKGDIQAAKEMKVFLNRAKKNARKNGHSN